MWTVSSPNGKLALSVEIGGKGGLSYRIEKHGQTVTERAKMGIIASIGDFTNGLAFERQESAVISEAYSIPAGKKREYENKANELTLFFKKGETPFALRLRAYDDGAAFRYEIPEGGGPIFVSRETTEFRFPARFADLWLQDWVASYEGKYNATTWGAKHDGRRYGMPALVHSAESGLWLMINEANVLNTNGAYCISHLRGTGENAFELAFAPEEGQNPIKSSLPFKSPWRYVLAADSLNEAVNATLNYNLNPPSAIEDESWIKPARVLWAWWASDFGAQLLTEAMQYVDFAAAMGFEAVLLDAGWDYTWIKEFCGYARSRGVSPWIWSAMQYINTPETANKLLPLWKSFGVDGVKIDFYENDSAHTASCYQLNADVMREQKLMANFHGSTKPMGEGRTWPHFIAAEGVLGLEHYKWSEGPDAEHNCTVPFIRNAAGPMDYTPTGFSNRNRNTTMAHQMALAAVFESGCQHYAASIFQLEAWEGTDFLRRLKPKYDGVRVLAGYPGKFAAILRFVEKTDEWIIGCIANESRTLSLSLDFLGNGGYEAEIYGDTRMGDEITLQRLAVNKDAKIELAMPEHGGSGVYIARKLEPLAVTAESGYMCARREDIKPDRMRLIHGSERLILSETKQAVLLSGGAIFTVAGPADQKRVTVRVFYSADKPCELEISDGRAAAQIYLPGNVAQGVFAANETTMPLKGTSRLTVRKLRGDSPVIKQISIIDNDPKESLLLRADEAVLSGGAQLMPRGGSFMAAGVGEGDSFVAVGVGEGGEMLFDSVCANADGKYILRISYLAGVDGPAQVSVNSGDPIRANLGGLGGWGQTRRGEPLAREILVELKKGANTIKIENAEAALPSIPAIAITEF
jgi:alpha-glucosidase